MYGPLNTDEAARIAALPPVGRARGWRLYTLDGGRWLDCWLDGGRALAGHRPSGISLRLKNEIDRGLYAPYPSRWAGRLEKALLRLFPGYRAVRICRNPESAFRAAGLNQMPADPLDLPAENGVAPEPAPGGTRHPALWGRPWLPGHPAAEILFPILPVPGLTDVQPVLFADPARPMAGSDPVSPVILAALTRSCAVLMSDEPLPPPIFPDSTDIWEWRGVYMVYRGKHDAYSDLFSDLAARRILIAPSPGRPSILPPDLTQKERDALLTGRRSS